MAFSRSADTFELKLVTEIPIGEKSSYLRRSGWKRFRLFPAVTTISPESFRGPLQPNCCFTFMRTLGASFRPSRALLPCLFLAMPGGVAWAQNTGSAPVGVMTYAAPEHSTISLGVPLLRPPVRLSVVASTNGATVLLTGPDSETKLPLVPGLSYYLEVIGHTDASTRTLVGHRFEVDEAATLAAAAGTVVIDTGSAHNTTSAAALAGLADYRVAIRPHWTLAALFGSGPASRINAARSAARGDQVLAWNGHGFSVYYLRAGATPEWRNVATGSLNQDDTVVPPGTGLFLRRRAGAWSASLVGEVRTTPFARPVFGPSQLVAGGFPTPSTPTEWKLTGGTGLTAGTTPANSDRVLAWNGSQFSEYYLRASTVPEWRNTATGLIDHARAHIFPAQGAALLILRAPATGQAPAPLVQAVPFSL